VSPASWTHCVELLKIDDPLERNFYEKQAIREPHHLSEADFETRLLDNLQSFLLELLCKGSHNISRLISRTNLAENNM
jgi:predicted nuclease of restriction endonuclease-like (RecB) superfamily